MRHIRLWNSIRKAREAAVAYLENIIKSCASNCEKWLNSARPNVEQLCGVIQNKREENEARKSVIPDKRAMSEMINGLKEILRELPEIKLRSASAVKHTETDLKLSLHKVEIPPETYGIYELAKKVKSQIGLLAMRKIQNELCRSDLYVIVSWDLLSWLMFLKNSFGIVLSESECAPGIMMFGKIVAAVSPNQKTVDALNGFIKKITLEQRDKLYRDVQCHSIWRSCQLSKQTEFGRGSKLE